MAAIEKITGIPKDQSSGKLNELVIKINTALVRVEEELDKTGMYTVESALKTCKHSLEEIDHPYTLYEGRYDIRDRFNELKSVLVDVRSRMNHLQEAIKIIDEIVSILDIH